MCWIAQGVADLGAQLGEESLKPPISLSVAALGRWRGLNQPVQFGITKRQRYSMSSLPDADKRALLPVEKYWKNSSFLHVTFPPFSKLSYKSLSFF